jgi:hypothetical protein
MDTGTQIAGREDLVAQPYVDCGSAAAFAATDLRRGHLGLAWMPRLIPALRAARDDVDPAAVSALARVLHLSGPETRRWLTATVRMLNGFEPVAMTASLEARLREIAWAWAPLPFSTHLRRPL